MWGYCLRSELLTKWISELITLGNDQGNGRHLDCETNLASVFCSGPPHIRGDYLVPKITQLFKLSQRRINMHQ